jgi:hypothetical protein
MRVWHGRIGFPIRHPKINLKLIDVSAVIRRLLAGYKPVKTGRGVEKKRQRRRNTRGDGFQIQAIEYLSARQGTANGGEHIVKGPLFVFTKSFPGITA